MKHLLLGIIVCVLLCPSIRAEQAAVAPNGRYGACGPYYIWYWLSPDDLPTPRAYAYLCGITFNIHDVIDDFDFVYFTDQYTPFDRNQDGISDGEFLVTKYADYIEWRPPGGCIKIYPGECQGNSSSPRCRYAMIRIQPKSGVQQGRVSIPISVIFRDQPNGPNLIKEDVTFREYSNCASQALPDFLVQKQVDSVCKKWEAEKSKKEVAFKFTLTVRNTNRTRASTTLIDRIDNPVLGEFVLSQIKIEHCPTEALCSRLKANQEQIQLDLANLPHNDVVIITYTLTYTLKTEDVEPFNKEEILSFTNMATTLSDGSSDRVIISISKDGCKTQQPQPDQPSKGDDQ